MLASDHRRRGVARRVRGVWWQDSVGVKYFKIYRWNPDSSDKPTMVTYPVNLKEYVLQRHGC